MTLLELITGALEQLDRGTDAQTIEAWRDKLTRYLNDAQLDLADAAGLWRTDTLTLVNKTLTLSALPAACRKVLALTRNDRRWPFYYGVDAESIIVPNLPDGDVVITYRYAPPDMKIDTDVPDLPEEYHHALILYAAARERAMGDAASLSAARALFELYYAKKRRLRQTFDGFYGGELINRY